MGSLPLRAKSHKCGCPRSSSTAAEMGQARSALTASGSGLLLEIWFSASPANLATAGLSTHCPGQQQQTTGPCLLVRKDVPFLPKELALTFGNRHVDRATFRFPLNFPRLVSVSVLLLRKLFSNQTLHPNCWSNSIPSAP